jgi:hypothetical protein
MNCSKTCSLSSVLEIHHPFRKLGMHIAVHCTKLPIDQEKMRFDRMAGLSPPIVSTVYRRILPNQLAPLDEADIQPQGRSVHRLVRRGRPLQISVTIDKKTTAAPNGQS